MHSMTQNDALVVGGVDAHADAHHAAVLDQRGALLSTKSFPTTTPGYRQLLDWLSSHGKIDVVAVESTGSYAAALVRYLRQHGVTIVDVSHASRPNWGQVDRQDPRRSRHPPRGYWGLGPQTNDLQSTTPWSDAPR